MTTVQGLDKAYDPKKILKAFKKVSVSGRRTMRSIYRPLANSRQRSRTTLHAIRRKHCTTRRAGPRRNSHATATSSLPKKPSSEPTLLNPPSPLGARPSPISDRSSSCKAIRGTRSGISLLARGSSRRGRPRRRFRCESGGGGVWGVSLSSKGCSARSILIDYFSLVHRSHGH